MVNVKWLMLVDFLVCIPSHLYQTLFYMTILYRKQLHLLFILSYSLPLLESVSGKLDQLDSYLIFSDIFNKQSINMFPWTSFIGLLEESVWSQSFWFTEAL